MIDTLVVDDEPLARKLLRSLLAKEKDIRIVGECHDTPSALKMIRSKRPSLVFLDIQMPGATGIELLQRLGTDFSPYVIFVTAYNRYAVEAFKHEALDYILKPFDKERFQESLARARRALQQEHLADMAEKFIGLANRFKTDGGTPPKRTGAQQHAFVTEFVIKDGNKFVRIDINNIIWIEAANQYVRIHTRTQSVLKSDSLTAIEQQLDPSHFVRVHRSALVNTAHVKSVHAEQNGTSRIVLSNGHTLKLARSRQHLVPALLKGK